MSDQPQPMPETNGQKMTRLIREAPVKDSRQVALDAIHAAWNKPRTEKENDRD